MPVPRLIFFNEVQSEKLYSPNVFTEFGIEIFFNLEHPSNALLSIFNNPSFRETESKREQLYIAY